MYIVPVESSKSIKRQDTTTVSLSNAQLSYTLADRTQLSEKNGNFFSSFSIPATYNTMASGNTIALLNPELLQLNVDKIIIIPISENNFSEYIDGRSITLKVPQWGDTYKTIVSTFYSDNLMNQKLGDSPIGMFGPNNVSFLFSDEINKPYTGYTGNKTVQHNTVNSWDPTLKFTDRPSAVAYNELEVADCDTDTRPWSSVKQAISVTQAYPRSVASASNGYNYDIPVGFVSLDKGYIILTHPEIVNNIPWTSGSTTYTPGIGQASAGEHIINGSNAGATSGTTNIVFTSSTSTLRYEDISIRYLTSITCIAKVGQFYLSNNPTWPMTDNLNEQQAGGTGFDPIHVSQIGLYNDVNELIAVAKLDRPIEKTYDNSIVFTLEIDV